MRERTVQYPCVRFQRDRMEAVDGGLNQRLLYKVSFASGMKRKSKSIKTDTFIFPVP